MNVSWHRPSQKSSAFMYITSRMSSDGTRRVCAISLSQSTTTTVSSPVLKNKTKKNTRIKGATHDLCHLPTYQQDFAVKFNAPVETDKRKSRRRLGQRVSSLYTGGPTLASHLCVGVFLALNLLNHYCTYRRSGAQVHESDIQCRYVRRPTSFSLFYFLFFNLIFFFF